jgi:hypothetical protein
MMRELGTITQRKTDIEALIENSLANDIRFCIQYENNGRRLRIVNHHDPPNRWVKDFDGQLNRRRIIEDVEFLAKKFSDIHAT